MPPIVSKVKKKKLLGQSREIVSNVLKFMTREALAHCFTIPVPKVQLRVAAATGVSIKMLQSIKKETAEIERGEKSSFTTPDTYRGKTRSITGLNEFDKCIVRRTVHDVYAKEKTCPTIGKLKDKLQESIGYKGCSTSLRRILKEIGFISTTAQNYKKVLIEDVDIRHKRVMYLKSLKHYKEKHHPVVYTDEIFLAGHDCGKRCPDNCDQRMFSPLNRGEQLVIAHAGGMDGFVPNACTMWTLFKHPGGSNDKMNASKYMMWAETQLLPNLKPNSVVVIDNAAYHNAQTEKAPTSNSPRAHMIRWLIEHNIPYYPDMQKSQLYELIRLHKRPDEKYVFDELLKRHGHIVLSLPRYHSDLNPIEVIWMKLKISLAQQQQQKYRIHDLSRECRKRLDAVSKDEWLEVCSYVEMIEKQYADNEEIIDTEIEKILINCGGERSDNDEDAEHQTSDENHVSEEDDTDDESSCHSSSDRPPFELVECGEEPTMGYEQPQPDRRPSILETILEKPKPPNRSNANRTTPAEKKRKRKDDKVALPNGDTTTDAAQNTSTNTLSSVDAKKLKKAMQEVLNNKVRLDKQNDGSGASCSSSDQFAEVLIKEEMTLVDVPAALKNVFGEEEELPVIEIKQEQLSFLDECNPLGTNNMD